MYPNAEEVGLKISFGGGVVFAVIGLIMAVWSRSQLVLLDGIYSLLDSFFTFLILKVTTMVGEDRSKRMKLRCLKEYFLILRSGAIIAFLIYLLRENILIVLQGGKLVDAGSVGAYTFISVLGGGIFFYYLDRCSKHTDSKVLRLERKGWLIDTMLSASIALSLIISYLLNGSDISYMRLYIEQMFVIIIVLVNFPCPINVIIESFRVIKSS